MLLTSGDWIEPQDLTTLTRKVATAQFELPADGVSLEEVERQLLTQALERTGGNQTQAANMTTHTPNAEHPHDAAELAGEMSGHDHGTMTETTAPMPDNATAAYAETMERMHGPMMAGMAKRGSLSQGTGPMPTLPSAKLKSPYSVW